MGQTQLLVEKKLLFCSVIVNDDELGLVFLRCSLTLTHGFHQPQKCPANQHHWKKVSALTSATCVVWSFSTGDDKTTAAEISSNS